jgi:hypothetical protein
MILGVTATRNGATPAQLTLLRLLLVNQEVTEFHHGDCVGGDEQSHHLVREIHPQCKIVAHPPINPRYRAYCKADIILPQKDYIPRNHDIVDSVHKMVALPKSSTPQYRGGTWATIRYTKSQGKPLYIFYPNGDTEAPMPRGGHE